jgi:methyl-accepting chemotaxis protein
MKFNQEEQQFMDSQAIIIDSESTKPQSTTIQNSGPRDSDSQNQKLLAKLFNQRLTANHQQTGKMLQWVMIAQWFFVILMSLLVSPRTWIGASAQTHIHVYMAIILGGLLTWGSWIFIRVAPDKAISRYITAIAQLLYSGLIIHITGGRIESHFHIFGSLAILAFYQDWKVILIATAVTGVDHVVRGLFFPLSIYGLTTPQVLRTLEHVGWVVFIDIFLLIGISNQLKSLKKALSIEAENQMVQQQTHMFLKAAMSQLETGSQLRIHAESAQQDLDNILGVIQSLNVTSEGVQKAGSGIDRASEETRDAMKRLAKDLKSQSGTIEQSSAAIEQMVSNIQQVHQVSDRQKARIDNADDIVKQAKGDTQLLGEMVSRLGNAGSQITEMIGVISNVASQTQLLAMNAAIEAAHAGEAGLGFSVVATEIRNLSEKASTSTKKIREQVKEISQTIEAAKEAVTRSTDSYSQVAQEFDSARQGFHEIAGANQELTIGGKEILDAIHQLKQVTQTVVMLSEKVTQAQNGVLQHTFNLSTSRQDLAQNLEKISDAVQRIHEGINQTTEIALALEAELARTAR